MTKKIHGQDKNSTRMPPSSRPTAAPPVAIAAQTPSAFVRRSPSAKVVVRIESAAGATSAAPRPWRPRARIRNVEESAIPFRNDAAVKTTTPARKTRLRPIRSPALPPEEEKAAEDERYELTTHCRSASAMFRLVWIEGSATFTIVASRMTMNCARHCQRLSLLIVMSLRVSPSRWRPECP